MAASQEDMMTLNTIVATLNETLRTPSITREAENEAIELMELIPETLNAIPHPGRLQSLLLHCQPLVPIAGFTQIRLAISSRLRLAAMKQLAVCVEICTKPDALHVVGPRAREVLLQSQTLQTLMDVADNSSVASEMQQAVELLFVVVMRLPLIQNDFVQLGGVDRMIGVLFDPTTAAAAPEVLGFVAGILRILAESTDALVGKATLIALHGFTMLAEWTAGAPTSAPSHVPVLLWETLRELFRKSPTAYWETMADPRGSSGLQHALEKWIRAAPTDAGLEAATNFVRLLIDIEGLENDVGTGRAAKRFVAIAFMSSEASWRAACEGAAASKHAMERLRLQRYVVAHTFTRAAISELPNGFIAAFPALCNLLLPAQSTKEAMSEAAVLLSLMAAKLPPIRQEINSMVEGYRPWAATLHGTVKQTLENYATDTLRNHTVVVDVNQTILNDGEQAQQIDQIDFARLAEALLAEQSRRWRQNAGAVPLDTAALRFYLKRDPNLFTRHVEHLTHGLATSVLIEATGQALKGYGDVDAEAAVAESSAEINASSNPALSPIPSASAKGTPAPRAASRSQSPRAGVATPRGGGHPPPNENTSGYLHWLQEQAQQGRGGPSIKKIFGSSNKKAPFRPVSKGTEYGFKPKRFSPGSSSATPARTRRTDPNASMEQQQNSSLNAQSVAPGGQSVLDTTGEDPTAADEYMSMAMMMHLPITLGVHYNRGSRGAVRRIDGPKGSYLQPVHRSLHQSWSLEDVNHGELYVLYVPFHRLHANRLNEEIATVERHLLHVKKHQVTTPNSQRTRRWFLHDMLNYILPKTELLLRDMLDLLERFGAEEVVYQMGIIRLLDEGEREKNDPFQVAAEAADAAMPSELMRFSAGKFKDVLHSGNLTYAVKRLREHYFSSQDGDGRGGVAGAFGAGGHGPVDGVPSQLVDIEREIQKLERKNAEDASWGADGNDDASDFDDDDDVESDYDRFETAPQHNPGNYLGDGDDDLSTGGAGPMAITSGAGSGLPPQQSSLPPHLREALAADDATGALYVDPSKSRPGAAGSGLEAAPFSAPTINDFDAMYAAVENQQRQ